MVKKRKIASKGGEEQAGIWYRDIPLAYFGKGNQRIGQKRYPGQAQQWYPP
jgi:hypothetical protein